MVNEEIILRKLEKLRDNVRALRGAKDITWDKYNRNDRDRAFVERYLHISIQTLFDIANHIISYQGWKEPETYRESIQILVSHNVILEEKANDFQNMASFRNILVHHYEKIDNEVVFGIFQNRLADFDLFAECIKEYLKKLNN